MTNRPLPPGQLKFGEPLADELRWAQVMQPLVEFCRRAERAPDAQQDQPVTKHGVPGVARRELMVRVKGKLRAARWAWREGGPTHMINSALRWLVRRLSLISR